MILDEIANAKRRAHAVRPAGLLGELRRRVLAEEAALPPVRSLAAAIENRRRPRVIAEFKRRSPSAGAIAEGASIREVAAAYAAAGASAMSVLTDGEFFGGSLADLAEARAAAPALPLLRKDFLLTVEDVYESRLAGADAVLVIARLVDDATLGALCAAARALGLDALVEVHDAIELDRTLAAGARLVGVNHRDLDTLAIDLDLSARLAPRFPDGVVRVAESGIRTASDFRAMRERGYHAILVGEHLMRAPSPGSALRALLDGVNA